MPSDDDLKTMAADPALSQWLRTALIESLSRDPLDAAHDAGLLALVLDKRAAELTAIASAQAIIQKVAQR